MHGTQGTGSHPSVSSCGVLGQGDDFGIIGQAVHSTALPSTGVAGVGDFGIVGRTLGITSYPPIPLAGVGGISTDDVGVSGGSLNNHGLHGETRAANMAGVYGIANQINANGIGGRNFSRQTEGYLAGEYGAHGKNGNYSGYLGYSDGGVVGIHTPSSRYGYLGMSTRAGFFNGDVRIDGDLVVSGSITGGSKMFAIDHPLDPQNMYLYHAAIESAEMLNVYSGNVVLNANGEAVVQLPDYFESLNSDIRYQLTCIGGWAQIYIAEEVRDNRFSIAGGTPGLKVSWEITGRRHDAWAEKNPLIPDVAKTGKERGKYIHPEAFNAPESSSIGYEEHIRLLRSVERAQEKHRKMIERERSVVKHSVAKP